VLPAAAGAAMVAMLAAGAWYGYDYLTTQPIRRVVFVGEPGRIARADLEAFAQSIQGVSAAKASLAAVREAARRIPWVRDATVRRRFPDAVEVGFETYEPLARWGEGRMLSEHGELFPAPKGLGRQLPLFVGPDARATEMIAFHAASRPLFLGSGLQVREVRLSARGSWSLLLSDGTDVEVGRNDEAHRLQRFSHLLPRLTTNEPRRLARADLRYTNGFALVWGPAPAALKATQGIHESQG